MIGETEGIWFVIKKTPQVNINKCIVMQKQELKNLNLNLNKKI